MSDIQAGLRAILEEPGNAKVVNRFVRFAWAMALVPVAVYGVTVTLFRLAVANTFIRLPSFASPPIVAGLCAVLSVNIISALFVIGALNETPERAINHSAPATADSAETVDASETHEKDD